MPERLPRELRVLYELAHLVAGPAGVADVLERICDEARAAFGFQRALIARYRPADRTAHAVVLQGLDWPGEEWLPLSSFPFLEAALETGGTVQVRDAAAEQAAPAAVIERFNVRSLVALPLVIEGSCFGFLVADRGGKPFNLDEDDLKLLTALGWIAAVFVEKADQYERLQRLGDAKSEFISIASHELRTPIAVVHGVAATLHLRGDQLRDDQLRELREMLFEQTSRVRDLIEQLLDLSRIDAGAIVVKPEPFRPREQLDALLPRIVPDRLADIEVAVAPELELRSDPDGFERIVSNLITNALRYGRPPVLVRSEVDGAFRLVVEDRGDGVPTEFVPRLFERFSRSHDREVPGAGLGLSIAYSFAQALGGELSYRAADPRGACFTLELPL